jgi:hypothetical protein
VRVCASEKRTFPVVCKGSGAASRALRRAAGALDGRHRCPRTRGTPHVVEPDYTSCVLYTP